jgi:catechol 2,3-dioxygenase-like lactoylglutathione lyase family enzyme
MLKFDHLALPVADAAASRDWYVGTLGLSVEFEIAERRTVAVRDEHDFTIFLQQGEERTVGIAMWFQVADVDESYAVMSGRGVAFNHPPEKKFWGYGAELQDPDGNLVRLWDAKSMKER